MSSEMAQLRQLLSLPPSWKVWNELCEHLHQWPAEGRELALSYAREHLDNGWPEAWRKGNAGAPEDSPLHSLAVTHRQALPESPDMHEIWCPPGQFRMGCTRLNDFDDETPLTDVTLTRGFWMLETPITQGQWEWLLKTTPSVCSAGDTNPVDSVNWFSAVFFCNRLSERMGLEPAYEITPSDSDDFEEEAAEGNATFVVEWRGLDNEGWRLPTEAEWEWACRAGEMNNPEYTLEELRNKAWFDSGPALTRSVYTYKPNAWGLHDMLGNISEWCWDWYTEYPGGEVTDPTGATNAMFRVIRGGAWWTEAEDVYPTARSNENAQASDDGVGFRPVRTGKW